MASRFVSSESAMTRTRDVFVSTAGHLLQIAAKPGVEEKTAVVTADSSWRDPPVCEIPELDPVRVVRRGDEEQIVYRTSDMEMGKLYKVMWCGEGYALRKTETEVEFFKFYPDAK
ncbi:MAG: hypothetical protein MPI95_00020 [Nitrosopumilus sp.]|nr:hypothetical protein [Nitrosopumilus sp.]CAI9831395.1 hypothetical protein IBTHAUMO2_240113 [Nitrosopumilaceae archaeon]MDA7940870.1 hypothetical protein [Nitrosopumilus sp.]MDA7943274.1 hypothetical protein [Nitrosopumilus sp.]MDA7944233.1 hypothetical protein [Nitrosopumilus sp.]